MKRYSMLQPLYLSFFSRELYRDVRTNWKGTGFLYLLILLALTWLPVMVKLHQGVARIVRQEAPKLVDQMPKITIRRGEVSIDRPVPYTIEDPDTHAPLMVIDTSGTVTSFGQGSAIILLTRDKFMYRQPHRAETRIYDLTGIDDFTVDRSRVDGWVQAFRKYFAIVAYPFALAGSLAFRVIQMLLYAAIGMIFASMLKITLDYLTLLRLASVSITPVILLSTVLTLTGLHVPVLPLVSFAIAMGYLFFAVKANAGPEEPETPQRMA
jgi:hypothetical protein